KTRFMACRPRRVGDRAGTPAFYGRGRKTGNGGGVEFAEVERRGRGGIRLTRRRGDAERARRPGGRASTRRSPLLAPPQLVDQPVAPAGGLRLAVACGHAQNERDG